MLRRVGELDFRRRRDCRSLRTSTSAEPRTVVLGGSLAADAAELPTRGGFLVSFREVCFEAVEVEVEGESEVIDVEKDGIGLRSSIEGRIGCIFVGINWTWLALHSDAHTPHTQSVRRSFEKKPSRL